ncbi:MAG: RagB/SusD family nutrient uptake outer membrane protein, partial [Daejeonella sp.]
GVPLIKEVAVNPTEASKVIARSSQTEVYAFIIQDLKDAIGALSLKKQYPASELGRVTKGAAQTLLAQVYLFQNNYKDCLTEAMNVINSGQYSLYPLYYQVSNVNSENGAESIYEIQMTYRTERDMPNTWQQWQGVRGSGSGWGFFSPSENLANSYETEDPRRQYSIYFKGEPWPFSGEKNIKWETGTDPRANQKTMLPRPFPPGFAGQSPLNRVVLRYADVLLMAAECNNEFGNTGEALRYLEMVRTRAREGKKVLPKITETNKIALRHLIWNERRAELALEGYRAFDIRRYDKIEPGFAKALYTAMGKKAYTVGKHELYPIPQVEMDFDQSGILTQNPGW